METLPIRPDIGVTRPVSVVRGARHKSSTPSDAVLLRLATVLQSSLDIDDILRLFGREISQFVAHDDIFFKRDTKVPENTDGADHYCRYELSLMGRTLGEVDVRRSYPFTPSEVEFLESALCGLIYPLRNALLYEQAVKTALKDPVTGINNRAALNTYLDQKVSEHNRHGSTVSIIMFDIDLFKSVNDRYGHLAGDAVLAAVAGRMISCTRSSDIVFRYGGEEFLVVLSSTTLAGALLLAERIRRSVEQLDISLGGANVSVTISAGVAEIESGNSPAELVERADRQLYKAKSAGRNRVYPTD